MEKMRSLNKTLRKLLMKHQSKLKLRLNMSQFKKIKKKKQKQQQHLKRCTKREKMKTMTENNSKCSTFSVTRWKSRTTRKKRRKN